MTLRMQRIVGLDTSLTATGIGVITRRVDGSCIAATTVITSRGKRDDTITDRRLRIVGLSLDIVQIAAMPALVVLEGPSFGSKGGSPLDRYGLWWMVVDALLHRDIPVAICPPHTRSKFAAGSGNADKAAVAVAMIRAWPSWEPESSRTTNDEGDALALAHAGAVWLGWDVTTLQRHRDALDGIAWPDRSVGELEVPA